jgi:hypothetical protein
MFCPQNAFSQHADSSTQVPAVLNIKDLVDTQRRDEHEVYDSGKEAMVNAKM